MRFFFTNTSVEFAYLKTKQVSSEFRKIYIIRSRLTVSIFCKYDVASLVWTFAVEYRMVVREGLNRLATKAYPCGGRGLTILRLRLCRRMLRYNPLYAEDFHILPMDVEEKNIALFMLNAL